MQIIPLAPGVSGVYIPTERFKTSVISVNMFLPIMPGKTSRMAILPSLLRRACKAYPTMQLLGRQLDALYGTPLMAECDKIGDVIALRLSVSVIEDKYALQGEPLLEQAAELLEQLIFEPLAENGGFNREIFAGEQRMLIELIESEINNKRAYAINRLCERICEDEPFGAPCYGTVEEARALTPELVYESYEHVLKNAYFRINVVGAAAPDAVFSRFAARLCALDRADIAVPQSLPTQAGGAIETSEKMAITQGKLVMGFTAPFGDSFAATAIMADIFGGGPYSRLFNHVRERLSLCYYCACRPNRRKGLMLVDSGVLLENVQCAKEEILRQLDVMKAGEFTDEELAASRQGYRTVLLSALDSQAAIDRYYADRVFDSEIITIEQYADMVSAVTREEVTAAAKGVELKGIFLLEPTLKAGEGEDE